MDDTCGSMDAARCAVAIEQRIGLSPVPEPPAIASEATHHIILNPSTPLFLAGGKAGQLVTT